MVLKLHRYAWRLPCFFERLSEPQARTNFVPSNQGEAGLYGKAEVCIVDVHVTLGCSKGMGFYEGDWTYLPRWLLNNSHSVPGPTRTWLPGAQTDRSGSSLHSHGIYWCLSSVCASHCYVELVSLAVFLVAKSPMLIRQVLFTRNSWILSYALRKQVLFTVTIMNSTYWSVETRGNLSSSTSLRWSALRTSMRKCKPLSSRFSMNPCSYLLGILTETWNVSVRSSAGGSTMSPIYILGSETPL